jgi:hypothetical protein
LYFIFFGFSSCPFLAAYSSKAALRVFSFVLGSFYFLLLLLISLGYFTGLPGSTNCFSSLNFFASAFLFIISSSI